MVLTAFIYLIVMYTIATPVFLFRSIAGDTQKIRTTSFITFVLQVISTVAVVILWLN